MPHLDSGRRHCQLFPDLAKRCGGLSGPVAEHLCGPFGLGSLAFGGPQGAPERLMVGLEPGHAGAHVPEFGFEPLGRIDQHGPLGQELALVAFGRSQAIGYLTDALGQLLQRRARRGEPAQQFFRALPASYQLPPSWDRLAWEGRG
jgi:hypothetical protein